MSQLATRAATARTGDHGPERAARRGSGALLGLCGDEVWRRVLPHLPLESGRSTVRTSTVPEIGALTHLLWWAPSVGAVLVSGPRPTDVGEVRRVIELTGSDALLLVDAPASRGLAALEHDARWADLVVVSTDDDRSGRPPEPAAILAWSARLARSFELLDGMHPLSYDVLARFR